MTFTVQDGKLSAGRKMKNFRILLFFLAMGLLLFAGMYRPVCTGNVSCLPVESLVSKILCYLHKVMTETISMLQAVKTYLKMFNVSV